MIPYEAIENNVDFVTEEFKELINRVGMWTRTAFNEEYFRNSIRASNIARDIFQKTAELLKTYSIDGLPNALMQIVSVNSWGAEELVHICKKLYAEASEGIKNPIKKKRAIWVGQIPYHGKRLVEYLQEKYEILYRASLYDIDFRVNEAMPLQSLAKRLILSSWNPARLAESILKICNDYGARIVISQNPWGCRNLIGINSIIRDRLRVNGIKVLIIDNDFMDASKVSFSHVKNRIDAFTEING
jgi:benzoyl-CoA reductase/2-hydroxyglutaryl-CoA dehydratase subunit BcrC/BadD/HgdB